MARAALQDSFFQKGWPWTAPEISMSPIRMPAQSAKSLPAAWLALSPGHSLRRDLRMAPVAPRGLIFQLMSPWTPLITFMWRIQIIARFVKSLLLQPSLLYLVVPA